MILSFRTIITEKSSQSRAQQILNIKRSKLILFSATELARHTVGLYPAIACGLQRSFRCTMPFGASAGHPLQLAQARVSAKCLRLAVHKT